MLRRILLGLLIAAAPGAADAQVVRAFVSTSGVDNANCLLASPCRSFAAAIAAVQPGGEVVVLDSGGYGPFTIDKAVSIISPLGVYAAITATSGAAISITAANDDEIAIRNLLLNAQGGAFGISVTGGGIITVEQVVISGFSSIGLFQYSNTPDARVELHVTDSIMRGNLAGASTRMDGTGAGTVAIFDRCRFLGNRRPGGGWGFFVGPNVRALIRDSVASRNRHGLIVSGTDAGPASLTVVRSAMTQNVEHGVHVGAVGTGFAVVRLDGTTIVENFTGVRVDPNGTAESMGNNLIRANPVPVFGSLTAISGQ